MSESNLNYKNKRILQIIPNMEIGGAERTVLEITSFLKDKEFSSLVLTSGGKLIGELEKENIEVIKLKIDNFRNVGVDHFMFWPMDFPNNYTIKKIIRNIIN